MMLELPFIWKTVTTEKLSSATLPHQEQNGKQINIDGAGSHCY